MIQTEAQRRADEALQVTVDNAVKVEIRDHLRLGLRLHASNDLSIQLRYRGEVIDEVKQVLPFFD